MFSPINVQQLIMICQRCTRLLSHRILPHPSLRGLSTSTVRAHPNEPPPVKSTSAAQPFSTPFTPSPSKTPGIPPNESSKASGSAPRSSSVAAGTPLRGLGYIKGQEAPLAKEDKDYPEWLWGLLDSGKKGADTDVAVGDAYGKSINFHIPDLCYGIATSALACALRSIKQAVGHMPPLEIFSYCNSLIVTMGLCKVHLLIIHLQPSSRSSAVLPLRPHEP